MICSGGGARAVRQRSDPRNDAIALMGTVDAPF
jgi:hypothetical protein